MMRACRSRVRKNQALAAFFAVARLAVQASAWLLLFAVAYFTHRTLYRPRSRSRNSAALII